MTSAAGHWLARIAGAQPGELRAVLWSFAYFFFLLASYFILRPLRDEMGIAAGRDNLQWLFTATFFAMIVASPLYALAISRLPRRTLIPLVYQFFVLNLLAFWAVLLTGYERALTAQVFFVWVSVFNLFAVSVFWSFMTDLYRSEQGKRLFGFIAAGGTAGTMLGSTITVSVAGWTGPTNLLLVAATLLEIALACAYFLERAARNPTAVQDGPSPSLSAPSSKSDRAIGGSMLEGFGLILRSPYLAGIGLWVLLLSLAGTFLYFMQQDVVRNASTDPAVRTQIFATMDLAASFMTLAIQFFLTGHVLKRLGTGTAAATLPLVFAIGFAVLAVAPLLAVVVAFQALQRTANFALSNPARETFFTAVDRHERYKAKNLIDAAIFRGGDVMWAWAFAALRGLGLGMSSIAMLTVPVALAWLGLALALGRSQERRSAAIEAADALNSDDQRS
jgi:ATP:ADP antiporter, AAA family